MVGENRDIRTGNRKMRLKQVWRPRHTYIYNINNTYDRIVLWTEEYININVAIVDMNS